MIKTYKLTTPSRNSSIIIRGKTNNAMRYDFTGGDPLTGKASTIMLRSQYAQDLLEGSEYFKQGYVALVRTAEGGEKVKHVENVQSEPIVKDDIVSPEQLLEFVAIQLEKTYQRPEAALVFATKKGYEFPNLNLNKD